MPEQQFTMEDIFHFIQTTMPENMGIKMEKWTSGGGCSEEAPDQLRVCKVGPAQLVEMGKDPEVRHIISMINRPGSGEFLTSMEHSLFPPLTDKNDELEITWYRWFDMIWWIASFPADKLEAVKAIAGEFEMRIANGTPTMIAGGELTKDPEKAPFIRAMPGSPDIPCHCFPLSSETAFSLEGCGEQGYTGQKKD